MLRIYMAGPCDMTHRGDMTTAKEIVDSRFNTDFDVVAKIYCPWKLHIPHAWDMTCQEWGRSVFAIDVNELNNADFVIALNYGREYMTAGTAWEIGYAFAQNKKILVVDMNDAPTSLMIANGCYATVKGLDGLKEYDFTKWPMTRSENDQT